MSAKVKEIFHNSIRPYKSGSTPVRKELDPALTAEAAQDGYVLVDIANLRASEMTKMMIKDVIAGCSPLRVAAKYDINPADLVVRLAWYGYEQGLRNGDMTK